MPAGAPSRLGHPRGEVLVPPEVTASATGPGAAVAVALEGTVIAADPPDITCVPGARTAPSASVRM